MCNREQRLKRAIIIAAGEGSRLRPVTLTIPKPLVPVNGIRLIDTSINALKKNGIHDIYIVAGYKKELFHEAYKNDPEITIIDNPYFLNGNNITSLYVARDYIPESFIIEGDLRIFNESIFNPWVKYSGYFATFMENTPEWALTLDNGVISNCCIEGGINSYRLWGVSMWTQKDGEKLAELVKKQIEEIKKWDIYWDEVPLFNYKKAFELRIREIKTDDIIEIDSFDELVEVDSSYRNWEERLIMKNQS